MWAEDTYNSFFFLRVALTNCHGTMHKLCDDDSGRFNRLKNPMDFLRKEKKWKRSEQQSEYDMKRKRRQEVSYRGANPTKRSEDEWY